MVEPAQPQLPPAARRNVVMTLLVLLGLRPGTAPGAPAPPPARIEMVERDGWMLDAQDR